MITYEGIVLVIGGLGNKDGVCSSACFDEVMCPNIYHNLCARINLRVQLLLQLPQRLWKWRVSKISVWLTATRMPTLSSRF